MTQVAQHSQLMISERQWQFIQKLLNERQVPEEVTASLQDKLDGGRWWAGEASKVLDRLLKSPYKSGAASVPQGDYWPTVHEGRYAMLDEGVLKFYKVDRPNEGRWSGYIFLSVYASDERYPIKAFETKKRVMDNIAVNPKEAAQRYGQEIGKCGLCGRTLTDETSRAFGIGPICRAERKW